MPVWISSLHRAAPPDRLIPILAAAARPHLTASAVTSIVEVRRRRRGRKEAKRPQDFESWGFFCWSNTIRHGDQTDENERLAGGEGDLRAGDRHEAGDLRDVGARRGRTGTTPISATHRLVAEQGDAGGRLGGAPPDLAARLLRGRGREQRLRRRELARAGRSAGRCSSGCSRAPTGPASGRFRRRSSRRTPPASSSTGAAASASSAPASESDNSTASGATPF